MGLFSKIKESIIYDVNVYQCRYTMGRYLAKKIKNTIKDIKMYDYIIPVPDTSKPCALSISKILKYLIIESITKIVI